MWNVSQVHVAELHDGVIHIDSSIRRGFDKYTRSDSIASCRTEQTSLEQKKWFIVSEPCK